jgi:TonB family protein
MAQPTGQKILRIGIVQNGKIIEERLLRKRGPVSIGQSPKNTFVLPSSPFQRSFTLFDLRGGAYALNFKSDMDGRVSVEDAVLDLKGVIGRKLADQKGDVYALTLSEKSRGKVVVGDVTLLFQFVVPPPPPSKLQLPANVRRSFISNVDWNLTSALLGSMLMQGALVGAALLYDPPEKPRGIEVIPDRVVELLTKPKKKEEVVKKDDKGDDKKEEVVEKKDEPKPVRQPVRKEETQQAKKPDEKAATPVNDEVRKEEVKKEVANKTILKFLGTTGEGGAESIVDKLAGGSPDVNIATAFEGASGVQVADADTQERDRRRISANGGAGNVAGLKESDIATKAGGPVDTGKKAPEVQVKANVKASEPSETFGTGTLDQGKISDTVKRRMGAVKSCYEKELKRNPELQGKVTMQFTIEESGRVGAVDVKQDTMGDPAVGECIKSAISRWRFDSPEGGSITVAFPFIFSPSN